MVKLDDRTFVNPLRISELVIEYNNEHPGSRPRILELTDVKFEYYNLGMDRKRESFKAAGFTQEDMDAKNKQRQDHYERQLEQSKVPTYKAIMANGNAYIITQEVFEELTNEDQSI